MYIDYFGLKENPFTISPNPRYLYMSEHHREALAHLLYGISGNGCLILLTGDVGTGKTTVCRSLLEQLPENTETAMIVNPKLSVEELLETICEELDIPFSKNTTSIKTYIDGINTHLLKSHTEGKTTVLIIDEAQNLDMEVLEQLRLLTNLETDTSKLLKIVLIGQPELQEKLKDPRVSQIDQRITSRYHLAPLQKNDVVGFIRHRLIVAGGGRMQFFTEKALEQAYRLSRGIPRLINILCDRALLGAYAEEKDQVSETIMLQAAEEVFGEIPAPASPPPFPFFRVIAVALFTLLFAGAATFFFVSTDNASFRLFSSDFFKELKNTATGEKNSIPAETMNAETQDPEKIQAE
ncbi:MAG: AAA family ATPase [Desulfopila sp.]|jgi:general secretion pathway protein A|nr:AAA family ATPase [Desulfopila sp.]